MSRRAVVSVVAVVAVAGAVVVGLLVHGTKARSPLATAACSFDVFSDLVMYCGDPAKRS